MRKTAEGRQCLSYLTQYLGLVTPSTRPALGAFAFKNKVKAPSVRLLWDKLSIFIAETLRAQKVGARVVGVSPHTHTCMLHNVTVLQYV